MELQNRTAVITGGNSGIGLASAKALGNAGANLVIMGRDSESLKAAGETLGEKTVAVQGDVTRLADLDRLFAKAKERFGTIHILVANAGIAKFAPLSDFPEHLFDEIVSVNLKGVFFTVQKALPLLREESSIIMTGSSMASTRGAKLNSLYLATKSAVRSLARSFADELKDKRIRVNVVSPGLIETPILQRDVGEFGKYRDQLAQMYQDRSPFGRLGKPEEIAQVVLFLASNASSYVNGAEIVADAGMMQL